ncbi:hypothetical protein N9901_02245 [Flavobacteriaceae bacterium]|nr:hypothetical protein [Flavobacteriaceae bacterium]
MKVFIHITFLIILCFSCTTKVEVKELDTSFKKENRLMYQQGELYTGTLFYSNKANDTLWKKEYHKGMLHGAYKKWHTNGTLTENRSYHNNLKAGTHYGWWSNGKPKFKFSFNDNGTYEGTFYNWYSSGKIFKQLNFKDGFEDGAQKAWNSQGKLIANYYIANGEKYGLIGSKSCMPTN